MEQSKDPGDECNELTRKHELSKWFNRHGDNFARNLPKSMGLQMKTTFSHGLNNDNSEEYDFTFQVTFDRFEIFRMLDTIRRCFAHVPPMKVVEKPKLDKPE